MLTFLYCVNIKICYVGQIYKPLALADPRGRQRRASPGVQILSFSCSFQSARPLRKILDPPLFSQYTMTNVNLHLNLFTGKSFQLIPLEIVQKCQYCQLCVLRENSNMKGAKQSSQNQMKLYKLS